MNATRRLQLVKRKGKKTTEVDIGAMEAVRQSLGGWHQVHSPRPNTDCHLLMLHRRNKEAADAQVP